MSPEIDGVVDEAILLLEPELREGIELALRTDDPDDEAGIAFPEEFGEEDDVPAMGAETLLVWPALGRGTAMVTGCDCGSISPTFDAYGKSPEGGALNLAVAAEIRTENV